MLNLNDRTNDRTNGEAYTDAPLGRDPAERGDGVYVSSQPSLGALFASLSDDLTTLVRQELLLAKTETTEKISQAMRGVISLVAGGLLAYAGLITLISAAVLGLGTNIAPWLAALIIGLAVVVVGALLVLAGRSQISSMDVVPQKTVESLQQDVQLVKEKIS